MFTRRTSQVNHYITFDVIVIIVTVAIAVAIAIIVTIVTVTIAAAVAVDRTCDSIIFIVNAMQSIVMCRFVWHCCSMGSGVMTPSAAYFDSPSVFKRLSEAGLQFQVL